MDHGSVNMPAHYSMHDAYRSLQKYAYRLDLVYVRTYLCVCLFLHWPLPEISYIDTETESKQFPRFFAAAHVLSPPLSGCFFIQLSGL